MKCPSCKYEMETYPQESLLCPSCYLYLSKKELIQQARIEELEAELAKYKLKWVDGATDDGWFWVKNWDGSKEVVYLEPYYGDDFGYDKVAGPIPPPEEE
jgi:hypothetical protein